MSRLGLNNSLNTDAHTSRSGLNDSIDSDWFLCKHFGLNDSVNIDSRLLRLSDLKNEQM